MTSGHIATAGVSRRSHRQHTPDSRYGRYGTSAMRSAEPEVVHLAFRSKRGAQSPQITSFHPVFCTPDRSLGIYYVWLLFGPHMMSTTVLKYARYINSTHKPQPVQSSAAHERLSGRAATATTFPGPRNYFFITYRLCNTHMCAHDEVCGRPPRSPEPSRSHTHRDATAACPRRLARRCRQQLAGDGPRSRGVARRRLPHLPAPAGDE